MGEADYWPTDLRTANETIPGELAWPTWVTTDAAADCNAPFGAFVGIGQGSDFKRYQRSNYEGLRGLFREQDGKAVENHSILRIYRLWEWVGFVVSEDGIGTEEVADTLFQTQSWTGHQGLVVGALADRGTLYFWDGITRSREDGTPVMIHYYKHDQGLGPQGTGGDPRDPNIGFYEMRSLARPAKEETASTQGGLGGDPFDRGSVASSGSGGVNHNASWAQLASGYGGTAAGAREKVAETTATVEHQIADASGPDKAIETTYAEDLAFARLVRATSDPAQRGISSTPLLSQYRSMRQSMLLSAGNALDDSHGGYAHTNPDRMQAEINANIRARLEQEGFADHWVDFFMTKENVSTITPAGYDIRSNFAADPANRGSGISGFTSGALTTGILAGTEPAQIQKMLATPTAESAFQPSPTPPVKIVIRAPFGYIKPGGTGGGSGGSGVGDSFDKPQLIQWFPKNYKYSTWTLRTLDIGTRASDKYIFDYAPNEVQYQGLGAEWVEVPRTGDLPLVEFSKWSLMRVTMQFLIANTNIDDMGRPHPDGLVTGVYDKIEKLRTMAQRPFPVSALNIDQLLRVSMKRATLSGEPLEFVISDFSITSMQRSIVAGTNEITAAQCSLTLQEVPIEATFKSKFARPKIAPPIITPAPDALGPEVEGISRTTPETSQTHTGFGNLITNPDSLPDE